MQVVDRARADRAREWSDLLFAWQVCRHVRSNAIVIARELRDDRHRRRPDEPRRRRAHRGREGARAAELLAGSALASDAFFPFADGAAARDRRRRRRDHPARRLRARREVVAAADAAGSRWSPRPPPLPALTPRAPRHAAPAATAAAGALPIPTA